MTDNLIREINNRTATVGIIGLGYVGLPLLIRFVEEGFNTIGFDIDQSKCELLNSGKSYIKHINSSSIRAALEEGFMATYDWQYISEVNCIIICVPTPLSSNNSPDLQYIRQTIQDINIYLKQ